jgi:hypothetical protein
MTASEITDRHWTEKAHPALLDMLALNKNSVAEARRKPPTRRELVEGMLTAMRIAAWPFNWRKIPEPFKATDSAERLARKFSRAGRKTEETTYEYVTPLYFGQPYYCTDQPVPECPITIEAENRFTEYLNRLAVIYARTRASRRPAVLQKISHAVIA